MVVIKCIMLIITGILLITNNFNDDNDNRNILNLILIMYLIVIIFGWFVDSMTWPILLTFIFDD